MPTEDQTLARKIRSGQRWRAVCADLRATVLPICHLCEQMIDTTLDPRDAWSWTADHVMPLIKLIEINADPYDLANLRPAHRRCNSRKGSRPAPARPTGSRRQW